MALLILGFGTITAIPTDNPTKSPLETPAIQEKTICFDCFDALIGPILSCIPDNGLYGPGLTSCVTGIIGEFDKCIPCICWVANQLGIKPCN